GPVDAEGVGAALLADHRDVVLAGAARDRLGAEERRLDVEERGLVLTREARRAHLEPLPLEMLRHRVPRGRRRDLRAEEEGRVERLPHTAGLAEGGREDCEAPRGGEQHGLDRGVRLLFVEDVAGLVQEDARRGLAADEARRWEGRYERAIRQLEGLARGVADGVEELRVAGDQAEGFLHEEVALPLRTAHD